MVTIWLRYMWLPYVTRSGGSDGGGDRGGGGGGIEKRRGVGVRGGRKGGGMKGGRGSAVTAPRLTYNGPGISDPLLMYVGGRFSPGVSFLPLPAITRLFQLPLCMGSRRPALLNTD